MVHRRKITAEEYYSDPHLKRLLNVVFNKYRSYGSGRGKVKLVISSQEEAERLQVFFGPQIRGLLRPGDLLSVDMGVIEEELGKCFMLTIPSLYELLYHKPLLTKKESLTKADAEWESLFIEAIGKIQRDENINIVDRDFCDSTYDWLYRLWKKEPGSGYRIVQAGMKNYSQTIGDVISCLKALWHLFMGWEYVKQNEAVISDKVNLSTFSCYVFKDPRTLDPKKSLAGRLFFRALEDNYAHRYCGKGEADPLEHAPSFMRKRMVYRLYHLCDDQVSSFFHKFTLDIYESMKKETVNLSNVEEMDQFEVKSNLFLIENPSVFHYLVDCLINYANSNKISLDLIRDRFPIVICTSGCLRAAVLEFVRRCIGRNSKCRIYFSGDFDRAGIEMMEKLEEYFPGNVSPFQMNEKIYLSKLSGKCRELSEKDREILAGKNSKLARLMALHGKKVFQESIASDLWNVLLQEIQCVETIMYQTYAKEEERMETRKAEIFLSYCWQDEEIAADIYEHLRRIQNVNIHKDTIDIKKWESIKEYMNNIVTMDFVILLISDAYLRSRNCMYEVLELMRDRKYKHKIFPAVVSKDIYNPAVVARYVRYWQDQQQELEETLSGLKVQNLGNLNHDLKIIQDIASNTADFLGLIGDMNNPEIADINIEIVKKLEEWGGIVVA
ncbi:DUF2399 domain-containing protein [Enterocloster citroniae]|nr:DUF2399 domain-containing protein [Enterocloster citroniae]MCB7068088.1 DUF2399 domain-containing protein [Enterocloster citroniae]